MNAKHTIWNSRISNKRRKSLAKHAEKYNYQFIGPNEPTYSGTDRVDVLNIFIFNNIKLTVQIHTTIELSSNHSPVFLEIIDWKEKLF